MTKLLTPKKLAATAALASIVLTLTATALAHSTPPIDGAFTPTSNFLRSMVLAPTDLARFASISCPSVQTSAADWAGADTASIPALRAAGFEMGITERLYSTRFHAAATSTAVKFATSNGAVNDLDRQLATAREDGNVATFPVAGIPDAHGTMLSANGATDYRIDFTHGTYEYGVSISFQDNPRASYPAPSEGQLLTAARIIYHRATTRNTKPSPRPAAADK